MPKVGDAFYEVSAHDGALNATLDRTDARVQASGSKAEHAYSSAATGGLNAYGKAAEETGVKAEAAGGRVGGFGAKIRDLGSGAVIGAGMMGFQTLLGGLQGLAQGFIGGAAQNEQYRVQLEVMLGSVDKAKGRLAELTEFAKATPFELPEIIAASNQLQVFTDGALSTGDGLRLVGDVAAGVGKPIGDVSFWFGRLYDAMRSGQPLGEATMNLQQMGAMSGDSRKKLEELAASVASGKRDMTSAWADAAKEFGRFGGMMDKQSATLSGQWSNLTDTIGQGLAGIGGKALPLMKGAVQGAIVVLAGLFDVLGFVSDAIGVLAQHGEILAPIVVGLGVALLAAAVPALIATAGAAWAAVPPLVAAAAAGLVAAAPFLALGLVIAALAFAFETNFFGIRDIVQAVFGVIGQIIGGVIGFVREAAAVLVGIAKNIVGIAAAIPGPWQSAASDVQKSLASLEESLRSTAGAAGGAAAGVAKGANDSKLAVVDATPGMKASTDTFAAALPDSIESAGRKAVQKQRLSLGQVAQSVREGRKAVTAAYSDAIDDSTRLQEIGYEKQLTLLELNSKDLAAKLKSRNAAEKIEAQKRQLELQTSYSKLLVEEAEYGTKATQTAKLNQILQSDAMKKGLKDADPLIRAEWENLRATVNDRLLAIKDDVEKKATDTGTTYADTLEGSKAKAADAIEAVSIAADKALWARIHKTGPQTPTGSGDATVALYVGGMNKKAPAVTTAASALGDRAKVELTGAATDATTWGQNLTNNYASGMRSAVMAAVQAAIAVAAAIAAALESHSPPKEGPLRHIDQWPVNLMRLYGDQMASQRGYLSDRVHEALSGARDALRGSAGLTLAMAGMPAAPSVTLRHEIVDPDRALAAAGVSDRQVAAMLQTGTDASGLLAHIRRFTV